MADILLRIEEASKFYPGVKALENVSLEIKRGEVHGLLGENGAGKSTLVGIITGAVRRDKGKIFFDGEEVGELSPLKARKLGIVAVYQELSLLPNLTVAENLALGRDGTLLNRRELNRSALLLMQKWGIENISPDLKVGFLGVSKRQLIEILRALSFNAKLIVMDEPTSALGKEETNELFRFINGLKERGISVLYISHKLEEILRICDSITVLRDGQKVKDCSIKEVDEAALIELITGRAIQGKYPHMGERFLGNEILKVENLKVPGTLKNISFVLREREILGFTGLVGAGKTELAQTLFGMYPYEGRILIDGKEVYLSSPRVAISCGIALLPEDRREKGLVLKLSITDNIFLPKLSDVGLWIKNHEKQRIVKQYIQRLAIKTPSPMVRVENLSGGNQQKVCVAKWLAKKSRVFLFDEPTRGIDVGAKTEIYRLIADLAAQGAGIIVFSSEFPEVMGICDRIIVLRGGEIGGEVQRENATEAALLSYATWGNSSKAIFTSFRKK